MDVRRREALRTRYGHTGTQESRKERVRLGPAFGGSFFRSFGSFVSSSKGVDLGGRRERAEG